MSEIGSYYFWKWADNDLPGRPAEVHAALLRGESHPALQPFEARPLLKKLEQAAADGRECGEEWDWQVTAGDNRRLAQFVFVTCPLVDASEKSVRRFDKQFSTLGLSGCDEANLRIIPCLPPKLNVFITGQLPCEPAYDIGPEDLPFLIRRIDSKRRHPFGILEMPWRGHFVQCLAHGRRFCVEWSQTEYSRGKTEWDHWRARDAKRFAALGSIHDDKVTDEKITPDLVTFTHTLRVFQTFLARQPRPSFLPWRNISHIVSK